MKPSEVLAKAADLIEPEGAWTQGALGRDENEDDIEESHELAVCWCAIGALCEASGDRYASELRARVEALIEAPDGRGTYPLARWNDTPGRTQSEVVAALRSASDLARSEGQ